MMVKCSKCGEEFFTCSVNEVNSSGICVIYQHNIDIEITQDRNVYERTSDWACIECNTEVGEEDSISLDKILIGV